MFSSTREALTYEFYQTPEEYFPQMPLILMYWNIKTYRRDRVKLLVWEVFLSAPRDILLITDWCLKDEC